MKQKLLEYLRCPKCSTGIILLENSKQEGGEVLTGTLVCAACDATFPIIRGVPRFTTSGVAEDKAATAENFGWQWQHFTQRDELYAEQFLGWIAPVRPEFFEGKVVLEGGCGKGRHTQLAAEWGAREVIGIDLSDAVESAFSQTRHLENAHIVQADIYSLPFLRCFDYAFSVGVLHHLPDPKAGFLSLCSHVKAGGFVSAWVYGAENNEWIVNWINPLRTRVTSRIDKRLLLHISKLPAALVYGATKIVYGPMNRRPGTSKVARYLFYNDYLNAISRFGWREQHTIVFDHLVAPTAYYISRDEFEGWWHEAKATDVVIEWHNRNSWRGFGKLPAST